MKKNMLIGRLEGTNCSNGGRWIFSCIDFEAKVSVGFFGEVVGFVFVTQGNVLHGALRESGVRITFDFDWDIGCSCGSKNNTKCFARLNFCRDRQGVITIAQIGSVSRGKGSDNTKLREIGGFVEHDGA